MRCTVCNTIQYFRPKEALRKIGKKSVTRKTGPPLSQWLQLLLFCYHYCNFNDAYKLKQSKRNIRTIVCMSKTCNSFICEMKIRYWQYHIASIYMKNREAFTVPVLYERSVDK